MWLLVTLINTMVVIRFESTETSHRLLGFPSPAFTDWTSTGLPFRYQCFLPIDVSIELAHNIRSQWVQPIVHPKQVGHGCMVNSQAITIQLACVVIVD